MREILFKAKTLKQVRNYNAGKDDGQWVKGFYYADTGLYIIKQFELDRAYYIDYEIDPETLCQFTGLRDKNGNKIFEGDIIEFANGARYKIIFEDYMFKISNETHTEGLFESEFDSIEIIGNIFDNKELVEQR